MGLVLTLWESSFFTDMTSANSLPVDDTHYGGRVKRNARNREFL